MLRLDVQRAVRAPAPATASFRRWAAAALGARRTPVELAIRVVGERESRRLNARYRGKDHPTNVLSFPCDAPALSRPPLGDLVICARVVAREAKVQGKPAEAHWAHMVVHGVLHLLGYDHMRSHDAARMEAREIAILARLGYSDPYRSAQGKAA